MKNIATQVTLVRILLRESAAVQAHLIDPEASLSLRTESGEVHAQIASVPTTDKRPLTEKRRGR